MVNVAVIYYSSTGTVHALAEAVAEGAREAGADVRLRRVPENAPREAVEANAAWKEHLEGVASQVPEVSHDDLTWSQAVAFGTPTRFGNVSAQLKAFLDTTGPLWAQGELADKAYTGFTSAMNAHGGNETTLLALYNSLHHFGGVVVAPGYTDPAVYGAGGNPYGTSWHTGPDGAAPDEAALTAARHQGRRLATIAARLVGEQPDARSEAA